MTTSARAAHLPALAALLVAAFLAAALVSPLAARRPATDTGRHDVVLPIRAAHGRRSPGPAGATFALDGRAMTRQGDRIHLSLGPGRPEWLFTRNPRDPHRASAVLIDRAAHLVVEYDESELAMSGIASSWDQVASRAQIGDVPPDPRSAGEAYAVVDAADWREARSN